MIEVAIDNDSLCTMKQTAKCLLCTYVCMYRISAGV